MNAAVSKAGALVHTLPRAGCAPPLRDNWWRRGANATLRVARSHGWRASSDRYGGSWIGRDWNGRSGVKLGKETVAGETVAAIVEELRRGIAARDVPLSRLPDRGSVRLCPGFGCSLATLVVDVDFGDFILPVSVDDGYLAKQPDITAAEIGAGMADLVLEALATREKTAAEELRLRETLEEQSSLTGIVPLWLRMTPRSLRWPYSEHQAVVREMTVLKLDEDLRPVMGDRLTSWAGDIELYVGFYGEMHVRRAAVRARLKAAGSAGLISEVALALVQVRGMEPSEVFSSLSAKRLAGDQGGIVHVTDTSLETLTFVEGVVNATIEFQGGNYEPGKLTLEGDYPSTLVLGAKRRPLSVFVDHPAFAAAGVTIRQARALRGRLRLYHEIRTIPIEEATRTSQSNAKGHRQKVGGGECA